MDLNMLYAINGKITEEMIEAVKASEFYQKYGKALYVGPVEVYSRREVIIVDYDRITDRDAADMAEQDFSFNDPAGGFTFAMDATDGWMRNNMRLVHKKEINVLSSKL